MAKMTCRTHLAGLCVILLSIMVSIFTRFLIDVIVLAPSLSGDVAAPRYCIEQAKENIRAMSKDEEISPFSRLSQSIERNEGNTAKKHAGTLLG
ncbi:hypothetical protein [Photobacterium sp. TY1-4]|uniref:hypothetical protein n=1 Tax=Photobacterium sp. TY1-4 TaxID=2899122 RepID=UPI0021C216D4|nr:hypothetical protein [Photobacterium sp. TY1-4]UXI02943.1 hypothetical protein NH461_00045 [Photobacterium sp. TY1-4]